MTLAVSQCQVAPLFTNDRACGGETKPDTAGVTIARSFETEERIEHPLQRVLGNSRPLVNDLDADRRIIATQRHAGSLSVFHGVIQKIDDDTFDAQRPAVVHHMRRAGETEVDVLIAVVFDDGL